MPVVTSAARLVAQTGDVLGEIPLWHPQEEALYWVDLLKPALHRFSPSSGHTATWTPPEKLGAFCLQDGGGTIVAGRSGIAHWEPMTGAFRPMAAPEADRPSNIMNDGRCDARGRFLFGSMDRMNSRESGRLWSLGPDGNVTVLLDGGILLPNGLCWSPCGRTLYFGDSRKECLFAYDYDPETGVPSNRRLFADTSELPGTLDGCSVDELGFVWHARFGGGVVVRFTPDGRIDQTVPVPSRQPTHLTFGGPDLRTLFITTARFRMPPEQLAQDRSAGGLLAMEVGVRGLRENLFPGLPAPARAV